MPILPDTLEKAMRPLMELLPFDQAMSRLVVRTEAPPEHVAAAETVLQQPGIAENPALQAGVWLYVDDLHRSHTISQNIQGATGAFWHGIMHRREGDFGNARYWFSQAGNHPAMDNIPGYNAYGFIQAVEQAGGEDLEALAARQREEWRVLFAWCAENA